MAYLTEEIEAGHAARAAGTYVAGTTIGGLLGRLVAAPVAELTDWRWAMFVVGLLCSAAAVGFMRLAPEPQGSSRPASNPRAPWRTDWPPTSVAPGSWCSICRASC